MADGSKIEWTDATWNVVTGCTRVSPGCERCYIERTPPFRTLGRRFDSPRIGATTGVTLHSDRLHRPLRWRRPRRVFVCSLADLFHAEVPDRFIAEVWAVMAIARQHTFQVLTKRHGRMHELLDGAGVNGFHDAMESALLARGYSRGIEWPLPNVWLGVSAENQQWADIRVPALLQTPAAVRWLSCEPLLGPVELDHRWLCSCGNTGWVDGEGWSPEQPALWDGKRYAGDGRVPCGFCNLGGWHEADERRPGIDWVVGGGESGPGARPMHPDWARGLRDQCGGLIPFFFKQWGEWLPLGPVYGQEDLDDDEAVDARVEAAHLEVVEKREVVQLERSGYIAVGHQPTDERTWLMARVGKRRAGRLLDGKLHDAYPGEVT